MNPHLTLGNRLVRHSITVVALVAAWCALWGEATPANLISGLVVAIVIVATGLGTKGRGGVRLIPLIRLIIHVTRDLIISTVTVTRTVIAPTDRTNEAIIGVEVPPGTSDHLLLMVISITVTPGTAVVDSDPDRGILYLHVLDGRGSEEVAAQAQRLANLACQALPTRIGSTRSERHDEEAAS